MSVTPIRAHVRARTHQQLRVRIQELKALQSRVADELLVAEQELAAITAHEAAQAKAARAATAAATHRAATRPECPSEPGYQWHRQHEPHNWPLPYDDPCGCRNAHRLFNQLKVARATKQDQAG